MHCEQVLDTANPPPAWPVPLTSASHSRRPACTWPPQTRRRSRPLASPPPARGECREISTCEARASTGPALLVRRIGSQRLCSHWSKEQPRHQSLSTCRASLQLPTSASRMTAATAAKLPGGTMAREARSSTDSVKHTTSMARWMRSRSARAHSANEKGADTQGRRPWMSLACRQGGHQQQAILSCDVVVQLTMSRAICKASTVVAVMRAAVHCWMLV